MTWHSLRDCFEPDALPADPHHRALGWVRQAWASLAGGLPPGAVAPSRLSRQGVLTLAVRGEAAARRVRAERPELLKRLRAFLGPNVVTDVRWEVENVPAVQRPAPATPPPAPLPPPPEAARAACAIEDSALRELFTAACRALGGDAGRGRG